MVVFLQVLFCPPGSLKLFQKGSAKYAQNIFNTLIKWQYKPRYVKPKVIFIDYCIILCMHMFKVRCIELCTHCEYFKICVCVL